MSALSLEQEIQKYLPLLGVEEQKSLLSQIKTFLNINQQHPVLTREEYLIQYNKELAEAEKRIDAGLFTTQEDLEKESENWFK